MDTLTRLCHMDNDCGDSGNDHILSNMIVQKEMVEAQIEQLQNELRYLPKGGLCRKVINNKSYLYHYSKSEDQESVYKQRCLGKDDVELIAGLKRRKFIELCISAQKRNLKVMKTFLLKYRSFNPLRIIARLPFAYKESFKPEDLGMTLEKEGNAWAKEPYESCPHHPDGLVYGTIGGIRVRSKSEAIIAGLLESNNIPFRYEAALKLGNHTYYPDFTIKNPRNSQIIYWEHFGMVGNADYNLAMEQKLLAYIKNGLMPWDKLITTHETETSLLDAHHILMIIKALLLP